MERLAVIDWSTLAVAALAVVLSAVTALHVVLNKRDVRSAIGWVGLVLVFPIAGPILYVVFGINRIRRRARLLGRGRSTPAALRAQVELPEGADRPVMPPSRFAPLAFLMGRVVHLPLVGGNRIEPLVDGEEAFPPMLEAIAGARRTLTFATYIFDRDEAGREFEEALAAAVERGVEVRVLVDAMGARYSFPTVIRSLRRRGVPTARFMKSLSLAGLPFLNLRNHRKILVADGRTGFAGGINVRQGHRVKSDPKHPVRDLHFRVEGPIVSQLQAVFAADWAFTTGEKLAGEAWFPRPEPAGAVLARLTPDGPDEDIDKVRWSFMGALSAARESVKIVTPYFLPDQDLVTALSAAALRGVEVEILLPGENNLPYVQWASQGQLWQVLEHGCRVWFARPPFDHSKMVLVDGGCALVGSSNWDPRSLRLNFELNLELYDADLCARLDALFEEKREGAREIDPEAWGKRPLPHRVRDAVARLALPYL